MCVCQVSEKGGVGKTCKAKTLAALCGRRLRTFQLTSDADAMELLGTFEQVSFPCKSISTRQSDPLI